MPVKDSLWTRVRNPYGLWAKENYQKKSKVYRKRGNIEGSIGVVKNTMGTGLRIFTLQVFMFLGGLPYTILLFLRGSFYCFSGFQCSSGYLKPSLSI